MAQSSSSAFGFDTGQAYLGVVYAKALLGVTEANGTTQQVLDEFDSLLTDVLDKLPQFEATLASVRVKHEEKLPMLDRAFAGKMTVELLNFLKVVSRHGRLDCLRTIHRTARRIYDQICGRIEVQIRSAVPLDQETLDRVRQRLAEMLKRDVVLETKLDPEIVGGLVIRVGDTVYDASLASQLQQMRSAAVDQTMQTIRQSMDRFVAG